MTTVQHIILAAITILLAIDFATCYEFLATEIEYGNCMNKFSYVLIRVTCEIVVLLAFLCHYICHEDSSAILWDNFPLYMIACVGIAIIIATILTILNKCGKTAEMARAETERLKRQVKECENLNHKKKHKKNRRK